MIGPVDFDPHDLGLDEEMMWQGDGHDWYPWDDEEEPDNNDIVPVLCWDAVTKEEDGKIAKQMTARIHHKCGLPPKLLEEYRRAWESLIRELQEGYDPPPSTEREFGDWAPGDLVNDDIEELPVTKECHHQQPLGHADAPLPPMDSPVTLASLLLTVREGSLRQLPLAALVSAVTKVDGRDLRPSFDLLKFNSTGDMLMDDAGASIGPRTSVSGVGTDVRLFWHLPNLLAMNRRRRGDLLGMMLAVMDMQRFRLPSK